MDSIEKWFESKLDYTEGVKIYKSLPTAKSRLVQKFERGKSNHNMALLIKELRTYKANLKSNPNKSIVNPPSLAKTFPEVSTDKEIAIHYENKQLQEKSKEIVFGSIRYGELPPELRIRYKEAASMFYKMCELKFSLNELPKEANNEALSIELEIDSIDEKRETIWKELHHWQNHKTFLPSQAESFDHYTPAELFKKRNNLRSQVTKIKKRISTYYENLSDSADKHKIKLMQDQINRSEKKLHQHILNIEKLNDLL